MPTEANSINSSSAGIVTNTGTGFTSSTVTQHGVVVGGASNAVTSTAVGSTGQVLQANSAADPTYSTATYPSTAGSSGNVLTSNGTNWTSAAPATSGTVTTVSVVSANGFAGTVANASSTPAITLSTTITGVLSGNGTAISGSAVTQYDVLVGGASNAISSVGPGSAGEVFLSNGNASNPAYSTTFTVADSTGSATLSSSQSGSAVQQAAINTSNTASSVAAFAAQIAGSTALGAYYNSNISGTSASNWSTGTLGADSNWYLHQGTGAFGSNPVIKATTTGYVTKPLTACFAAYVSATTAGVTGNGATYTVLFNTKIGDQGTNYATGTGIFTAPVAGYYLFTTNILMGSVTSTAGSCGLFLVTTSQTYQFTDTNLGLLVNGGGFSSFPPCSTIAKMSANDTAKIQVQLNGMAGNTATVVGNATVSGCSVFSGVLLC